MQTPNIMTTRNKNLDGLRGFAASNVILHHYAAAFTPSLLTQIYPEIFIAENTKPHYSLISYFPLVTLLYNGHLAVMIFFALSGYILVHPHYTESNPTKTLLRRLLARYLRLNTPVSIALLLSYILYSHNLYFNADASTISGSTRWLGTFFHDDITIHTAATDAIFGSILKGRNALLPPIWTIQIEFVCSIYILLYYILLPRSYHVTLLLPVLMCLHWVYKTEAPYYIAFFLGALLARLRETSSWRTPIFCIGLYSGAYVYDSAWYNWLPSVQIFDVSYNPKSFYNMVSSLFIVLAVIHGFGARLLSHPYVTYLGSISFSLYLVHFIILCSLSCAVFLALPPNPMTLLLNMLLYIIVCFTTAALYNTLVERPAASLATNLANRVISTVSHTIISRRSKARNL
jgi:peptidoglycan/LPS O-acetylase OafA/YrhL